MIYLDNVKVNTITFSDLQITKEDKDWLYPQMIQAIKKVKDSIILVFSHTRLSELLNYGENDKKGLIVNLSKDYLIYYY